MGRLLNPGVGELADRMTILVLKCTRAGPRAAVDHFREELVQLQMQLDHVPITEEIRQRIAALGAVNRQLWDLEDQMAEYTRLYDPDIDRPATYAEIAGCGVRIWTANRRRNELIAEINHLAGTDRGPEKV